MKGFHQALIFIFLCIVALTVPWYLPQGSYEPIIFGFPYWALISIFMSIVLAVFMSWVIKTQWKEEDTK